MNTEVFQAIAARIIDEPRLYGATKAERAAACRARNTGLKFLEKAANLPEYDEWALEAAFKTHGMQLIRSTSGRSLIAYGDGLEIRQAIIKALRTYLRPYMLERRKQYIREHNAARPNEKKSRIARRARLLTDGINFMIFRSFPVSVDVIDEASTA